MVSKLLTQAYQTLLDLHCVPLRLTHPLSSHTLWWIPTEFLSFLVHTKLIAFWGLLHPLFLLHSVLLLSSSPHLALSEYSYLSLHIMFSEAFFLTHSAKQLTLVQPISPRTVLIYFSIYVFCSNTLHICTYAPKTITLFQCYISTVTLSNKNINVNHKYKPHMWLASFYKVKEINFNNTLIIFNSILFNPTYQKEHSWNMSLI